MAIQPKEKTPKKVFLESLEKISNVFENETGCDIDNILFHRVSTRSNTNPHETVISYIELTVK